jgi:hypothetical protein
LDKATLWSNTPAAGSFFDKSVNYIGAFGATDWTDTWSSFTPTTNIY